MEFRGRSIDGKWVYGSYIKPNNINPLAYIICRETNIQILVDKKTVSPYTGKADKSNFMLFEGTSVKSLYNTKGVKLINPYIENYNGTYILRCSKTDNFEFLSEYNRSELEGIFN